MYRFINFFKDNKGQVVICQKPNLPLIGWIIFTILKLIFSGYQPKLYYLFSLLSFGFIFTWAWLEITSGVNYFRRVLGLIVLIGAVFL